MKQNPILSPAQCKNVELADLLGAFLEEITQLDIAYYEAGPQRSAKIARSLILDSLQAVFRLVRAGLRVHDHYLRRQSGDDSILELLATTSVPSPLTLVYFELNEVQSGRVAPLLRHDAKGLGKGDYHFLRRYIQAGGAAALQVLRETGLGVKAAATLVANALNKAGFANPRGDPYSPLTPMDWYKRRCSKKAGFYDHYREWLLLLRGTVGRVEQSRQSGQSWTVEQLREIILFRIVNLSQVFAYQV